MTVIVALSYRYQIVDFPASCYYTPFGTLVPYPKENVNLYAALKPLSYQVKWNTIFKNYSINKIRQIELKNTK